MEINDYIESLPGTLEKSGYKKIGSFFSNDLSGVSVSSDELKDINNYVWFHEDCNWGILKSVKPGIKNKTVFHLVKLTWAPRMFGIKMGIPSAVIMCEVFSDDQYEKSSLDGVIFTPKAIGGPSTKEKEFLKILKNYYS